MGNGLWLTWAARHVWGEPAGVGVGGAWRLQASERLNADTLP